MQVFLYIVYIIIFILDLITISLQRKKIKELTEENVRLKKGLEV